MPTSLGIASLSASDGDYVMTSSHWRPCQMGKLTLTSPLFWRTRRKLIGVPQSHALACFPKLKPVVCLQGWLLSRGIGHLMGQASRIRPTSQAVSERPRALYAKSIDGQEDLTTKQIESVLRKPDERSET